MASGYSCKGLEEITGDLVVDSCTPFDISFSYQDKKARFYEAFQTKGIEEDYSGLGKIIFIGLE